MAANVTNWFFLRGLVREAAHWDDFPKKFEAGIPGSRVFCLDLPGNGEHWRLSSPLKIEEMTQFVRAEQMRLLSTEKTAGRSAAPSYLFSISLGAMVAIDWMRRYPGDIAGAVLVNTSLRTLSPFYHRLSFTAWPWLLKVLMEKDVARREALILAGTSRISSTETALVKARVAAYERNPVRPANVFRQLVAAIRYRPEKEPPKPPVLLLSSLGDKMVNPSCGQKIFQSWQCDRRVHPSAGHDLPLDEPGWCIDAVQEWLSASPDGSDW